MGAQFADEFSRQHPGILAIQQAGECEQTVAHELEVGIGTNPLENFLYDNPADHCAIMPLDQSSQCGGSRRVGRLEKKYGIDTALMASVSFTSSRNLGRNLENIVYLELLRRNREVYYWKSTDGKEVDFLLREGRTITEAIQVCSDLTDPKTRQRETTALLAAATAFPEARLTIVTEEEEGEMNSDGRKITCVPLWKWLLVA